MSDTQSAQPFNLEDFSKKAEAYYNEIKAELESKCRGKYAALDFESKKYWIGETASEALAVAKKEFSARLFYVVHVGFPATYTIQSMTGYPGALHGHYDAQW